MIEWLFNIGSGVLLIASIPNIYSAIKDRNTLRGYSKIGSILTMVGIVFFLLYALAQNYWIGFLVDIPTFLYWVIVTVYVWKNE